MAENSQQEPGRKSLKPLARLRPAAFLTRYKPQIAKALVALAIASGSTLVVPIAVRRIIDHGFTTSNATLVNQYFSVMIAVVLLLALSSAIRFYYVMWLGEKIVADVRDALFKHLLKLSPGFYETQKTGEVVSRLTADTTQIKAAFSSTASIALRNAVMLVGAIVMMIVTSPKLAGLAGLAIPLIVLPLVTYGRRVRLLSAPHRIRLPPPPPSPRSASRPSPPCNPTCRKTSPKENFPPRRILPFRRQPSAPSPAPFSPQQSYSWPWVPSLACCGSAPRK